MIFDTDAVSQNFQKVVTDQLNTFRDGLKEAANYYVESVQKLQDVKSKKDEYVQEFKEEIEVMEEGKSILTLAQVSKILNTLNETLIQEGINPTEYRVVVDTEGFMLELRKDE